MADTNTTIRVFDLASLSKLRDEYKCTSIKTPTANIPVVINGKLVSMSTGPYGTGHFATFKSYADTSFTEMYSYMFLIYLTTGDYSFSTGTGNIAFLSFSSSTVKDSILYYIPSGTYVCQIFVNPGYKLSFSLQKKYDGDAKNIWEYALKCESLENEQLIYDEFYEQILVDCAANGLSTPLCKRVTDMNITSDPRLYLTTKYNGMTAGTTVNTNWSVIENSCPATCGTGSKKYSRDILKYLGRGVAEKIIESKVEDCSVPCPVNGYFSSWSAWSLCSKDCGGGTQSRSRRYTPAVNGGTDLADRYVTTETRTCNTDVCPLAKVPSTKILNRNFHTYSIVDVRSPNGQYRFVWQPNGFAAYVHKLSGGTWVVNSTIRVLDSTRRAALGCYTSVFATYNTGINTPAVIGRTSMQYERVVLTDEGNIVFENMFGEPVDIALAAGATVNAQ